MKSRPVSLSDMRFMTARARSFSTWEHTHDNFIPPAELLQCSVRTKASISCSNDPSSSDLQEGAACQGCQSCQTGADIRQTCAGTSHLGCKLTAQMELFELSC